MSVNLMMLGQARGVDLNLENITVEWIKWGGGVMGGQAKTRSKISRKASVDISNTKSMT